VLISGLLGDPHVITVEGIGRLRVCCCCLGFCVEIADCFALARRSNLCNPFLPLRLPITPFAGRTHRPSIHAVLSVCCRPKVFGSVIAPNAIDMVNLRGPLSSKQEVDEPVLSERPSAQTNIHIAIWAFIPAHSCTSAEQGTIPILENPLNFFFGRFHCFLLRIHHHGWRLAAGLLRPLAPGMP
jgi:hypothetical protein